MDKFVAEILTGYAFIGKQRVASVETVTDTSINLSADVAELRTGRGNGLKGKIFHTSKFGLKLNESMWRFEWLGVLVSRQMVKGADVFFTEELTADSTGKIKTTKKPVAFGNEGLMAILDNPLSGEYKSVTLNADGEYTDASIADKTFCVSYKYRNDSATKLIIPVSMMPREVRLELEANIYNGDGRETRTQVGKIKVVVPRFQLNASAELAFTNTGMLSMPLEGDALSVKDYTTCNGDEYFAEISEIDEEATIFTGAKELVANPSVLTMENAEEETVKVYMSYNGFISPMLMKATDLTFDIPSDDSGIATVDTTGKVTAVGTGSTTLTITAKENTEFKTTVVITVA